MTNVMVFPAEQEDAYGTLFALLMNSPLQTTPGTSRLRTIAELTDTILDAGFCLPPM